MHRHVRGYHGGPAERVERILRDPGTVVQAQLQLDDIANYPWFGPGLYFHEENPERAQRWAEMHYGDEAPSVVCAQLDLSHEDAGVDLGQKNDRDEFLEVAAALSARLVRRLEGAAPVPGSRSPAEPDLPLEVPTAFIERFARRWQALSDEDRTYLLDGMVTEWLIDQGTEWFRVLVFTESSRYSERERNVSSRTMSYERRGMKGWRSRVVRDVCAFVVVYAPHVITEVEEWRPADS